MTLKELKNEDIIIFNSTKWIVLQGYENDDRDIIVTTLDNYKPRKIFDCKNSVFVNPNLEKEWHFLYNLKDAPKKMKYLRDVHSLMSFGEVGTPVEQYAIGNIQLCVGDVVMVYDRGSLNYSDLEFVCYDNTYKGFIRGFRGTTFKNGLALNGRYAIKLIKSYKDLGREEIVGGIKVMEYEIYN